MLAARLPLGDPCGLRTGRAERLAVFLWAAAVLMVCGRALLAPQAQSVYPIFAGAARDWQAGAGLYEGAREPFRYSPLIAALFVPLAVLPDALGGVVWRLLNAAALLGALGWWSRAALPVSLTESRRALLLLLVLPLAVGNLNNGQANPLILALLLTATTAAVRARWNLAAVCVALACLFKAYPIVVGLLLAVLHPRRFAPRLGVVLAAGLALPLVLQQPEYVAAQYGSWLEHLRANDRSLMPLELWYRDLRLLAAVCGVPLSASAYQAVQLLAGVGLALLCLAGRRAGWPARRLLTLVLGLGCCWMTALGAAAESATYILLAPSAAWALLEVWQRPRTVGSRGAVLVAYGLLVVSQMAVWFPWGRAFHSLGPQPLAGLLLLGVLLREGREPRGAGREDPVPNTECGC
ncbi:MAG: DUF2029 domain-containing protein [Gemmataceae bacterium]|nr:DUF2029 domain-containing protein [Gemmataceae bacterium]